MKKRLTLGFIIMGILLVGLICGCSSDPQELFETGRLEETQMSYDQARKIYHQIIEKYPDSEYAKKARERLDKLQAISK